MSVLLYRVESFVRAQEMIAPGERVLAAVSGGLDSMCLLELLAALRGKLDFNLTAANFDHGLRGAMGEDERALVEAACRRLGAGFASGGTDELAGLVRGGANLQAEARRLRYEFLWREADRLGCRRLATGHHRDDQAETVLLRMIQGSSLVGLAGIRPVSCAGRLIRPLLEIPRRELEQFASERGIRWLEDPSNETDNYRRNRIRHNLIPLVEREYDPGFSAALADLADEAAGLRGLLDKAAGSLMEDGTVAVEGGRVSADCADLAEYPAAVRRHALRLALEMATQGEVVLSGRPLSALERLALENISGKRLDLPGGVTAWCEFGRILAGRIGEDGTGADGNSTLLVEGLNYLRAGGTCWELDLSVLRVKGKDAERFLPDAGEPGAIALRQVFDYNRLDLPLSAGVWRHGERIELFGGGSKKLKKLFAERRVPVSGRGKLPVVRDSGGEVVWVCGAGRSSAAPVSSSTTSVLLIEARMKDGVDGLRSGGY